VREPWPRRVLALRSSCPITTSPSAQALLVLLTGLPLESLSTSRSAWTLRLIGSAGLLLSDFSHPCGNNAGTTPSPKYAFTATCR
jgi:hypothetical protein